MHVRSSDSKLIWDSYISEEQQDLDIGQKLADLVQETINIADEATNPWWSNCVKTMLSHLIPHNNPAQGTTMGVDKDGNVYVNLDFVAQQLSDDPSGATVRGTFYHEAMHIANYSWDRVGDRDHQLWNVATDYVMNSTLARSGITLPAGGLLPERRGELDIIVFNPADYGISGWEGDVEIDITGMAAEHVYSALVRQLNKMDQKKDPEAGDSGDELGPAGKAVADGLSKQSGNEGGDFEVEGIEKLRQEARDKTEEDLKNDKQKREKVKDLEGGQEALEDMGLDDEDDEDNKQGGVDPGDGDGSEGVELTGLERSSCSPHKNWLPRLKELFVPGASEKVKLDAKGTRKIYPKKGRRPFIPKLTGSSIRTPDISMRPTSTGDQGAPQKFKALVYIDVSGSVARYTQQFAGALACIMEYVQNELDAELDLIVSTVDTAIASSVRVSSKRSHKENIKIMGKLISTSGGGIVMKPCIDHAVGYVEPHEAPTRGRSIGDRSDTSPVESSDTTDYDTVVFFSDAGWAEFGWPDEVDGRDWRRGAGVHDYRNVEPEVFDKFTKQISNIGFLQIDNPAPHPDTLRLGEVMNKVKRVRASYIHVDSIDGPGANWFG